MTGTAVPRGLVKDPSCVHATLATLLREHGVAEPWLVLGWPLGTRARPDPDGTRLGFDPIVPELLDRIRVGVGVAVHDVRRDGIRPGLGSEGWVVVLVDTWGIPHMRENYRRSHSLHALLAWGDLGGSGDVAVVDAQTDVSHHGVLPAATLAGALLSDAVPTAVISLHGRAHDDGRWRADPISWAGIMRRQAEGDDDGGHLSLDALLRRFDRCAQPLWEAMMLLRDETRPPSSAAARPPWRLLRGLWNVSACLRWTAEAWAVGDLAAAPGAAQLRDQLRALAGRWMVVHHLLLSHGRPRALSDGDPGTLRVALAGVRRAQEGYLRALGPVSGTDAP